MIIVEALVTNDYLTPIKKSPLFRNEFPLLRGKKRFSNNDLLYWFKWLKNKNYKQAILNAQFNELRPVCSEFIPTLECPFKCPACSYAHVKRHIGIWNEKSNSNNSGVQISLIDAKLALDRLKAGGVKGILLTGGGEPTLHPELREIIEYAFAIKLKVGLFTNGTFIGKSLSRNLLGENWARSVMLLGLDFIRISLDTIRNHAVFHGYNPNKRNWIKNVTENIVDLATARLNHQNHTELGISILFDDRNLDELIEISEWILALNSIDFVIFRPVINYFGQKQLSNVIMNRALKILATIRLRLEKNGIKVHIPAQRIEPVLGKARHFTDCRACGLFGSVWPDGRMFICTETNGLDDFCIGNIFKQTIDEIYGGSHFSKLRDEIRKNKFKKCPLTCRPYILNEFFEEIEILRTYGKLNEIKKWIEKIANQIPDNKSIWLL